MSLDDLRKRLRHRKVLRERQRRLKHGARAKREARAVRRLRRRIKERLRDLTAPKTQYDSVNPQNIPTTARAAAYYVNGAYINEYAVKARAPKARYTSIAVSTAAIADCLDVEPGDASVMDAPRWYRAFKKVRPHRKPIFYCSASTADDLVGILNSHGIKRDQYLLWTAHYIGRHFCGEGCEYASRAGYVDATQYTTEDETLDVSACRPSFWRRDA